MDTSSSYETPSRDGTPQRRRRNESNEIPRRSSQQIQIPSRYKDYALIMQVMNVVEPVNYEQAKDHKEWRNAMNEEYESIMKNEI